MKKSYIILCIAISFFVSSCSDAGPAKPAEQEKFLDEKQSLPLSGAGKREEERENLNSPIDCALSKKEYGMWGILCRTSSHSKRLSQGNYHLISPTNGALSVYGVDVVALLKYSENKDLLDEFVGRHIFEEDAANTASDLNSLVEKIESATSLQLNEDKIKTTRGYFLGSTGCLQFPLAELEKRQKKSKLQK